MEYKKLGSTDLLISRIGFGCWAIGGHGYGNVNDDESIKAIHKALDLGVNFFDTADVYGFGHSEKILSKALGSQKDNVIIATKFGVGWGKKGNTFKDCSPKKVVEALEGSLRRLRIDTIPLYQIHWYDNNTPIFKTMNALRKCQDAGKVRYIGCSNFSTNLIARASKTQRIESLQCEYNIIKRDLEVKIPKYVEEFKLGIIVYNVLARGLLSGKFNLTTKFGDNDTRNRDGNFLGEKFKRNLQVVDVLKKIGIRYDKTPSQIAIRWVLDNKDVTCALIGIKNSKQIEENVGALSWTLSRDDRKFTTTPSGKTFGNGDGINNVL